MYFFCLGFDQSGFPNRDQENKDDEMKIESFNERAIDVPEDYVEPKPSVKKAASKFKDLVQNKKGNEPKNKLLQYVRYVLVNFAVLPTFFLISF